MKPRESLKPSRGCYAKTIFACVMKDFRTIVRTGKAPFQITHADKLVSIGSCFSENIGKKFADYKFKTNVNPFGQQYNPHSIAKAIERLLAPAPYTEKDLVYHDELYHSFDHHGSFSRSTVDETLQVINENLLQASEDLKQATVLFLTFGTSHVFELKGDEGEGQGKKVVSNCHKLSGNNFSKRLMKPQEIVSVLQQALARLQTVNSKLRTVLTVSPVRYFAFGEHENTVSKAHLFSAIHELQEQHAEYFYFPAYELVMDDLRDYRFFAEDMLHPNYQATDYVWEKLCGCIIAPDTLRRMKDIDELLLAVRHRPRNPQSEMHKQFAQKYIGIAEMLEQDLRIDLSTEKQHLQSFL